MYETFPAPQPRNKVDVMLIYLNALYDEMVETIPKKG